ncbi:DUF1697 domain-containing protein [Andreprevotia chitinilytica]|uniref:DUF1697 domain-containing protein n=1 Tax=Andreprevotia chitinilytica TaxID=396808 RepID=UPI00055990B7|nr:DUF1697 domain-containing protein [Andreprevotia chitinilytica]
MKYAAFFRNVNLGRPNSPSRVQLEQAFLVAGAGTAHSFLTNGTLVFSIPANADPSATLAAAIEHMQRTCGLKEPGFVRSVDYLRELVASDPFASVDPSTVYACCATFLHADMPAPPAVPLVSKREDVEVLRFTDGEALSLCRKIGNTPGSPNAFLEKHFALPATTRNWNTVVRLVQKHG